MMCYVTRLTKIRENSKGLKDLYTHTFLYVKLKSFLGLNLSKDFTGSRNPKILFKRTRGVDISGSVPVRHNRISIRVDLFIHDAGHARQIFSLAKFFRNVPKVTIMPVNRDYSRKPRRVSAAQGETTFDRLCGHSFDFPRQSSSPWETSTFFQIFF